MTTKLTEQKERRDRPRFSLNAPLTIFVGDRTISAYSSNVSDRGIYFYLALTDSGNIEGDFEFVLELPPEITLSSWCPIRCHGRVVRKEHAAKDMTGVAAEILQYSIFREPGTHA